MQNAAFFIKYKLHHLFFWMMLFGLWYFFRYEDYSTEVKAFQVTLIKIIDLALMVYLTNYLLIPFLLYKKRYALFLIVFLLMIISSSVVKMNILGHLTNNPALLTLSGNLKGRIYDNVIPHFFLVISGAAFKLMADHAKMQQRIIVMAKETAEAELNFLKSQINPHFLFNTLNSVYFLIDKNNPDARSALHKFSDMMRYQLYEMNGHSIPVEKEISYLQDYVDLQKLRKDENYSVEFFCSEEIKGFFIEPLLLIPFVENAFKHISHHKDKTNFINLSINRSGEGMIFIAENSKDNNERTTEQHGGIGLNNVKRRLELLYPGKHSLEIKDMPGYFSIVLRLKIIN
ncbi:MAG: histidine kinase [Ferruginibacter sp.]